MTRGRSACVEIASGLAGAEACAHRITAAKSLHALKAMPSVPLHTSWACFISAGRTLCSLLCRELVDADCVDEAGPALDVVLDEAPERHRIHRRRRLHAGRDQPL